MPGQGAEPSNIEVEWQLDALDLRPVERWLGAFPRSVAGRREGSTVAISAGELPVKRTVDVYLDTEDWRIGRSGFVLRVRHEGERREVTLKDTAPAQAGLRRRLELSEPLPDAGLRSLDPGGEVGRRLRALVGDAALTDILEVRTRRRPYRLYATDELLGEIDLDDTIIVVGDDEYPVRMRRVEVEVDAGWVDVLRPLVDKLRRECSLQPALLSKFEVGLLAAGLQIPTHPDLGPTTLEADPSVGAVAYAVLRRTLAAMLAHEAGTRLGEDIEELHDMRVATRRLRAALAMFDGVLPGRARRIRSEVGWLAAELGAVRDLDVQLQRLEGWRDELPREDRGALADLARLLDGERDVARESLLASLDSERYDDLVTEFTALLRAGPGQGAARQVTAANARAVTVVPGLILARHRSAVTAARRARRSRDPADFHRLRIRCKRLRYALEFVSEIYDGQTKPVVRRIVHLQDCLGDMQDAQVAATRLHTLALGADSGLSPAAVFAMGVVAERYRRDAERLVGLLPGYLETLKGTQWRRLKKFMERRRRQVGPPDTWSPGPTAPPGPAVTGTAGSPDAGPGRFAGGGGVDAGPTAPWGRARSAPASTGGGPEDDSDWDEECTPALHSLPAVADVGGAPDVVEVADDIDENAFPAVTRTPRPPASPPPGGRRRKEPVFLPVPPSHGRPGPARPEAEPPDPGRGRSFPDRH